jgi:hypothetical protein
MNLIPQPDDTLAERLAKLRAAWVYKREIDYVGRDPLTPGERVRTQTAERITSALAVAYTLGALQ